jgi:hypothetical protein
MAEGLISNPCKDNGAPAGDRALPSLNSGDVQSFYFTRLLTGPHLDFGPTAQRSATVIPVPGAHLLRTMVMQSPSCKYRPTLASAT